MMKKLLVLSAFLVLSVWTMGQTGWILVNSDLDVGRGVGQISIGMNDTDALWALAVGSDGAIVDEYTLSTDAGLTWNQGAFNAGSGLSQLFAIDATTCWAVFNTGSNQGVYKTTDGGVTWVRKSANYGSSSFANIIHFFNNNDGCTMGDPVGGYFEIYTTTDGGETWTRVPQANIPDPVSGEYGITGNYCAYENDIWFGTNKGRVYHSADKGLTWAAALTTFGDAEVVAPEFADALNGIAYRSYLNMGIEPTISVTSDGGTTWSYLDVAGDMYARYIAHIPGTPSTYVGSSSEAGFNGISYSSDGGVNWSTITAGYDFGATAWLDNETGWAGSIAIADKSTGGMYIYDGDPLGPQSPVADFIGDPTGIALGEQVVFTDLSTNVPTSWAWTFEEGTPSSSTYQTPPPVVYSTPGSFDVSLTVTNSFGSDTETKTDYIYVGAVGIDGHIQATVTVLPNPASDVIYINGSVTVQEVKIFNQMGQLVLDRKINSQNTRLFISEIPSGVYGMQIKIANGYINRKIIVN